MRAQGADLAVVFIPSIIQLYESYAMLLARNYPDDPQVAAFLERPLKPQELMSQFCREEQIPYVDL